MQVVKTAKGNMVKMSRTEWEAIGQAHGWEKEAALQLSDDAKKALAGVREHLGALIGALKNADALDIPFDIKGWSEQNAASFVAMLTKINAAIEGKAPSAQPIAPPTAPATGETGKVSPAAPR